MMILRRLRSAVPTILLLGGVLVIALTAVAQAAKAEYVTTGELHRAVVLTFLSGAGIVLAGIAWVYARDQRSRDLRADAAIQAAAEQAAETARQIRELADLVRAHHGDWTMHPVGSAGRLDRFENKVDKLVDGQGALREEIHALRNEHNLIQEQEGGICAALAAARELLGKRDPAASPNPKRKEDSGDDYRPLRGKQ